MREVGIDISGKKPKELTVDSAEKADKIITMVAAPKQEPSARQASSRPKTGIWRTLMVSLSKRFGKSGTR